MALTTQSYIGLGNVPIGIGAALKGWSMTEEDFRDPAKLPVVDFRAMTNACPRECYFCFTDKNKKTLSLAQIKDVIDQLAKRKTHAINFLGEGEPTIDKDFFKIVEYTSSNGIIPIVFTEAATKMRDGDFVRRAYLANATVCPKLDSLFNPDYQNDVVSDTTGKYFNQRNEAIDRLIDQGFNQIQDDGTTRLGFDMVVTKANMDEVERTLRYCRDNNLWIVFSTWLPAGRCTQENFDRTLELTPQDKRKLRETVQRVDAEYGFNHPVWNNFATHPCVEFMQIYGDGSVSPCPGNEKRLYHGLASVEFDSIRELERMILEEFPCHDRTKFDGYCLYRPK